MASLNTHIKFAGTLVKLMDTKYNFFGIRFGLDPLLDVVPWAGDAAGALISCYLLWIAYKMRVPSWVYRRIVWYIAVDYFLGLLPFIGIMFDLFYRSNVKSYELLRKFIDPDVLVGDIVS
jgi:hypothetical protein